MSSVIIVCVSSICVWKCLFVVSLCCSWVLDIIICMLFSVIMWFGCCMVSGRVCVSRLLVWCSGFFLCMRMCFLGLCILIEIIWVLSMFFCSRVIMLFWLRFQIGSIRLWVRVWFFLLIRVVIFWLICCLCVLLSMVSVIIIGRFMVNSMVQVMQRLRLVVFLIMVGCVGQKVDGKVVWII